MQNLIKEISKRLSSSNADEQRQLIRGWREEFKNKEISVFALETLLKHYSTQIPYQSSGDVYGFYNVSQIQIMDNDDDAKIVSLRNELQNYKEKIKYLQKKLSSQKLYILLLLIILLLSIFCNIYFLL